MCGGRGLPPPHGGPHPRVQTLLQHDDGGEDTSHRIWQRYRHTVGHWVECTE